MKVGGQLSIADTIDDARSSSAGTAGAKNMIVGFG